MSIHFGNVGGNVSVKAEGDVVGGNKETTTTTTTLPNGFKQPENQQQFLRQIEELRGILREVQAKIQEIPNISQDDKDEIAAQIMQQVTTLKKVQETTKELPGKTLEAYLQTTEVLLDKAKDLGEKAAEYTLKLAPYFEKALSLLTSARQLLGLP